jgi:hypothetical protein
METVGIYGQVTGGSETLIAVMTAETPDEMPVYDQDSPSAFIFNVQMSVQNANNLTMVVNDTGTATVADLNRKVDLNGGDLSDTKGKTFTPSTALYPVISAGDTFKVMCGKIAKFCADIIKPFTKATASAAGAKGLVPAPAAGEQVAYLRGDGTWKAPVFSKTTTATGLSLDAREANPNVSGSLAADVKALNDSLAVETVSVTIIISGVSNTLWIYKDKVGLTFEMNNQTEITSTIPDNVWTDIAAWPTSLPLPRGNIVSVPLVNNQVMAFRVISGRLQYHFRPNGLNVYLQGTGYNLHV